MNDHSQNNEDEIAEQAVNWCMRLHENDCSEEDRQAFKIWHDSNSLHARHYAETLQIWNLTAHTTPVYSAPVVRPAQRSVHNSLAKSWWQPFIINTSSGFRYAAILLFVIPFALMFGWFSNWVPNHYERYSTAESTKQIILADGSQLQLNLNTQLSFTRYKHQRHINFKQGEAYFHVKHDQANPFVVKTGPVLVTVTGTEFNVWKYDDNVVVTVIDGSVNVKGNDDQYSLTGKMQASYDHNKSALKINNSADVKKIMTWREGKLILDDLSLADAIIKINPYLEQPLIITNELVAKLRIGGIYNIANIKELPAQLPGILPVKIETQSDGSLLISRK